MKQQPLGFRASLLADQPYVDRRAEAPADDLANCLDLYVPEGPGPFPLVVWIHGGGWHSCNKDFDFATIYLRAGFAIASLNYRLTRDGHPFPAPIEDCSEALHWLARHAEEHRLDIRRIGLLGHSAGAHLAALLAMNVGQFPFPLAQPVPVRAAVLWSVPADLDGTRCHWPKETFIWNPEDLFCRTFFPGGSYSSAFANWASPMSYPNGQTAAWLIVHGEQDKAVPCEQARAFAEHLAQSGSPVQSRTIADGGHAIMSETLHGDAISFFEATLAPIA